jgi:hypothetical protein
MDFRAVSAVTMENVDFADWQLCGVKNCVKFSAESSFLAQSGSTVIALLFL